MSFPIENPIRFQVEKTVDGFEIKYSDLMEICQGGPEIGKLWVNNRPVSDSLRFGGPLVYSSGFIYAPVFARGFVSSGFILAIINATTLKVEKIGRKLPLIFLDRIEGNHIYFFKDIKKVKSLRYNIRKGVGAESR